MVIVHLFVSYAHVNLCHFFSSSWYRGLAATSAYGSSWTFLFTFFILLRLRLTLLNGSGHAKTCLMPYANNKGADQPAHPHSLISTFVVRCLDSMICILAISKVSRLQLASVAEHAGWNLAWWKIPEDTFSRDVAQMVFNLPSQVERSPGLFCLDYPRLLAEHITESHRADEMR